MTRLIFVGPTPGTGAGAARGRVGGGDEGIRAVVDVEQRALAALEEDDLALVDGVVEDQRGVGDVRPRSWSA